HDVISSLHDGSPFLRFSQPDSIRTGSENRRSTSNGSQDTFAWELGSELSGGVSQVQASCRKWEVEGSTTEQNREILHAEKTYTVRPKGILVIGITEQLLNDVDKRSTFELFRRNLVNPEILTFDELYERAQFIVERSSKGELGAGGPG
ncbi:MAG: Shedu anti-phage system protein SduA domain-containing protein, partial [Terriglobia bacterium]